MPGIAGGRADAHYATGRAMIAGGPFETEEEAREWLAVLGERGTCRSD